MLRIIARGGAECTALDNPAALWVDLEGPTEAEETSVERQLGIDVLTPTERAALEESARFYEDNGSLYLTATLLGRREDGPFISGAVTFILTKGKLVTVRQIRPRAFEVGQGRASARIGSAQNGADVLMALLDGGVERIADLLSGSTIEVNEISSVVFADANSSSAELRKHLRGLGRIGGVISLTHECLASLQRLVVFARALGKPHGLDATRLAAFQRDIAELERQAEALHARLSYVQDASLGLINATQTDVLKALSVATIVFVPPTLVASIFGMNFRHMTWFEASWGPWIGFLLMIAAPGALLAYAKWRRWF